MGLETSLEEPLGQSVRLIVACALLADGNWMANLGMDRPCCAMMSLVMVAMGDLRFPG
jgi:hypothetical protein